MENMGGDAKVADYLKANGDDKAEFSEMGFDSLGTYVYACVWCACRSCLCCAVLRCCGAGAIGIEATDLVLLPRSPTRRPGGVLHGHPEGV